MHNKSDFRYAAKEIRETLRCAEEMMRRDDWVGAYTMWQEIAATATETEYAAEEVKWHKQRLEELKGRLADGV